MSNSSFKYDESALMRQFREGNDAAFAVIYKLLHQRVYLFAKKYVIATADAQDMTAEVFVQLLQGGRNFNDIDGIAAFLHVAVRNRCFNLLKNRQMKMAHHEALLRQSEEKQTPAFFEQQVQLELMRKIYLEVDKLPDRMKEIFLLSYYEGLKPAEIAERLQIKPQTVINQRTTAIKLLQSLVSREPMLLLFLSLMELRSK